MAIVPDRKFNGKVYAPGTLHKNEEVNTHTTESTGDHVQL